MFKKLFKLIFKKELSFIKSSEFQHYKLIIDTIGVIKSLLCIIEKNTWDKDKINEIYDRLYIIEKTLDKICLDKNKIL